jgi:hypothetical protein
MGCSASCYALERKKEIKAKLLLYLPAFLPLYCPPFYFFCPLFYCASCHSERIERRGINLIGTRATTYLGKSEKFPPDIFEDRI